MLVTETVNFVAILDEGAGINDAIPPRQNTDETRHIKEETRTPTEDTRTQQELETESDPEDDDSISTGYEDSDNDTQPDDGNDDE